MTAPRSCKSTSKWSAIHLIPPPEKNTTTDHLGAYYSLHRLELRPIRPEDQSRCGQDQPDANEQYAGDFQHRRSRLQGALVRLGHVHGARDAQDQGNNDDYVDRFEEAGKAIRPRSFVTRLGGLILSGMSGGESC